MKSSRERFWQQVAMEFDKLNVALLQDDKVSMKIGEREYLSLQKKLLRQAQTEREGQHIKRLVAHSLLRFAYSVASTWTEHQKALRRVQRLGYLNLDYQSRAANSTLLWIADNDPSKTPLGWAMVEDVERRLLRLRRGNQVRKQALAAIASVKQRIAQKGLTQPKSPRSVPKSERALLKRRGGRTNYIQETQ